MTNRAINTLAPLTLSVWGLASIYGFCHGSVFGITSYFVFVVVGMWMLDVAAKHHVTGTWADYWRFAKTYHRLPRAEVIDKTTKRV